MRWVLPFFIFAVTPAHAEYRAFELVITDSTSGQERIVLSNLDPIQYPTYYPLKSSEKIKYRATWRCRGNTSNFQPICPKPEPAPAAKPEAKPTTSRP